MRSSLFSVCAVALLMACGCGSPTSTNNATSGSGDTAKKLRIAMIPKGASHEFWKSVEAGARRAEAEFNDVEVTWKGPLSEADLNDQISMIENFVADGYDGICVAPLDADALRKPLDGAMKAGIQVLIFDSALTNSDGIVSYVATNNHHGGQMAGEELARLLDGKGEVVLMRYALSSESTEQREQGFLEALKKHPDIKIIFDDYAGAGEDKAIALGEQILFNHGDAVDGIFCPNESTAAGMLTALRRDPRGLAGKVKLVGFDAGAKLIDGLEKGDLHATILQDPVKMGYESVKLMRDKLQGREVSARVETGELLATTENCRAPEVRKLLEPEASK
ncbi:MAG: substrate-binding domain-containing protein [Planctomycetia bacterium]|nr:substrate-binding domain-containing protein [Planctomycetia bacterium]